MVGQISLEMVANDTVSDSLNLVVALNNNGLILATHWGSEMKLNEIFIKQEKTKKTQRVLRRKAKQKLAQK